MDMLNTHTHTHKHKHIHTHTCKYIYLLCIHIDRYTRIYTYLYLHTCMHINVADGCWSMCSEQCSMSIFTLERKITSQNICCPMFLPPPPSPPPSPPSQLLHSPHQLATLQPPRSRQESWVREGGHQKDGVPVAKESTYTYT